jgi:peroxiredoxin
MPVKPMEHVPELDIPTVGGSRFRLSERRPGTSTLIVVYRGHHCPICKTYLRELDRKLDDFAARGVDVLALSTDTAERAGASRQEWELGTLTLGYGLPVADARRWGLFVSRGISDKEPPEFAEPGLFLVRPDGTLYAASIQTMPFARPHFPDLLAAVDYITKNDYPPRGEAWARWVRAVALAAAGGVLDERAGLDASTTPAGDLERAG